MEKTHAPMSSPERSSEKVSEKGNERWSFSALTTKDFLAAGLVGLLVFSVNFIWYSYDHHVPMMDEAGHILNGIGYRELFSHPSLFKGSWWTEILTVNRFYPPTVYIETGILKAILGSSRLIDVLVHSGYSFLLALSMVLIARLSGFGIICGASAGILVNMYPETSSMSHMFMLDFPAVAATSIGILSLCLWWQKQNIKFAILCGLILGACCLTKQIVTAFLLGTGLLFTVLSVLNKGKRSRKSLLIQLGALVAATVAVGLPWFLTNFSQMNAINEYAQTNLDSKGMSMTKPESCLYYLKSYWSNLSPLLTCLFISGLALIGIDSHRKLSPVWASAILGFGLMCLYVYPLDRYIMPSLILTALVSAVLIEKSLTEDRYKYTRLLTIPIILMALLQYLSFNFAPYPISVPNALAQLSRKLGVKLNTSTFAKDGTKDNPVPLKDWGYDWAFKTIDGVHKGLPVYLNIIVNEPDLNAQTFDLETKERKSPIKATTSLIWTIVGDELKFSEETALYYHWYMVKTGAKEPRFKDDESRKNYEKLLRFIRESGRYEAVDSMAAPDGDKLILYRLI